MATPTSAQGGGVVHAVAGHGDHLVAALQGLHQAELVLRRDPGEHVVLLGDVGQFLIRQLLQLGAGDRGDLVGQGQLAADGLGGARVVAGDHLDVDAGAAAQLDGLDGFGTRRVDDADDALEGEALARIVAEIAVRGAAGGGQDAQAVGGELVDDALPVGAVEVGGGVRVVGVRLVGAQVEDPVGRALEEHDVVTVRRRGLDGHVFVVGVERDVVGAPVAVGVEVDLGGQRHQGALGGLAADGPALVLTPQLGVVGHGHGGHEGAEIGVVVEADLGAVERDLAVGGIALARHLVAVGGRDDRAGGHLVGGERARLVGADRGHRTKGLDRGHGARDGVAVRHRRDAAGQRDRQDRGQTFGDRADREADGGLEQLLQIGTVEQPAEPEQGGGGQHDDEAQHLAERIHLLGQRRLEGLDLAQHVADPADLGVLAGCDDDAAARAAGDHRGGERHRAPVADAGARVHRIGGLLGGLGLAGERRLLDAQAAGLHEAQVGRHPIAAAEPDDVTRHDLLGLDLRPRPVAAHRGAGGEHVADALERLLRAAPLHKADDRIDHRDRRDDDGVHPVTHERRDHRRDEEHVDEHVVEVVQEAQHRVLLRRLRQRVAPVLVEPPGRLVCGQPGVRVGLQGGEDGVRGFTVGAFEFSGGHGMPFTTMGFRPPF
nr:hypothetical protein [Propioniciclava soli]